MKKLNAFTIVELVTAMAISAVLVSLGYLCLTIQSHNFDKYRRRTSAMATLRLLEARSTLDIDEAEWVRDTLEAKQWVINRRHETIHYRVYPKFVIRETGLQTDTFAIGIRSVNVGYLDDTTRLVNEIRILARIGEDTLPITLNKQYSATQIMKAFSFVHE